MQDDVMKLKSNLVAAIAVGAAMVFGAAFLGVSPAVAAEKDAAHSLTREEAKPLKAAQDALQKGDYTGALQKLDEADAVKKKSAYADHLIAEMRGYAYVRTHQYAQAEKALEPTLNDGFLPANQVPQRTLELAQLAYQTKNWDKAIQYGQTAIDKGWADKQMPTLVGQAYYLKGDWKGLARYERSQVAAAEKNGVAPTNQSLQLLLSACIKMNPSADDACATNALQELVVYYPKPEYWQNLLVSMYKSIKNNRDLLQWYRLASDVDILKRPDDYTEFAQLALVAGSPGEAEQIIEKGMQNNIFPDARSKGKAARLLTDAKRAAARDKATLAKSAAEAARASNGNQDVGLGLAYYGYQQYDKAVQALTQGIAKGGLKDSSEAHMLLGIAQLKAANKSAALQQFKAVKGDPTLEHLATLWSLRAKSGAKA